MDRIHPRGRTGRVPIIARPEHVAKRLYLITNKKLSRMKTRLKDLELKRFTANGKSYIKLGDGNWSVSISIEDARLTDRGLILKYYPNWRDAI